MLFTAAPPALFLLSLRLRYATGLRQAGIASLAAYPGLILQRASAPRNDLG